MYIQQLIHVGISGLVVFAKYLFKKHRQDLDLSGTIEEDVKFLSVEVGLNILPSDSHLF